MGYTLHMASASQSYSSSAPSAVRPQARGAVDILARLLASENIKIEHQPVPTAMFDTASRLLVLPVWKGMSSDLYDMLVGHEVGHALWTPSSGVIIAEAMARITAIGGTDSFAKTLLNIVEDVRIERLIKNKFPGIRRNFAVGYRELLDRDLFQLNRVNGDPNALGFLDRFNIFHKAGSLGVIRVGFTTDEQALVAAATTTESFEDVTLLCIEMVKFLKSNGENNDHPNDDGNSTAKSGGKPDADGEGQGKGKGKGKGEITDADGEGQGKKESSNDPATEQSESTEGQGEGEGEGQGEGEDQGQDSTDDTELSDCKSPAHGKGGSDNGEGRSAPSTASKGNLDEKITTEKSLSDGLGKMSDTSQRYWNKYATAPSFDMKRLVITTEQVTALWSDMFSKCAKATSTLDSLYQLWTTENKPTVMNMVKRFEQRKAADDFRRTTSAKTGRIDTTKLAYYKVSEDLFLSMSTTAEGKSHGLVMVVDWSGSMSGVLGTVLSQVLCLVEFCRKTGVPYEVYAFTDVCDGWELDTTSNKDCETDLDRERKIGTVAENNPTKLRPQGFRMVQLIRSGLTRTMHTNAVRGICGIMSDMHYQPFVKQISTACSTLSPSSPSYMHNMQMLAPQYCTPAAFGLGGTPLNEALLATAEIVDAFRANTGAQIVNVAVLTDGEATRSIECGSTPARTDGSPSPVTSQATCIVLHHKGKDYKLQNAQNGGYYGAREQETNQLIKYIHDRCEANVYGFFLVPERSITSYIRQSFPAGSSDPRTAIALEQADREGSACVPHTAYDEYYIVGVASRTTSEDDLLDALPAIATPKAIRKAFLKGAEQRNTSRSIMVRFADCFAVGKPSGNKSTRRKA